MSDAMLKSPVQCNPYYAWSSFWGGIRQPIYANTCVSGYADGSGKVRFRLPLGSWEFDLCSMYTMPEIDLVYSMLDPDAGSETIQIRSERDERLAVVTDEWGNAALEISGDIPAGVKGGAVGVIRLSRGGAESTVHAYRGHPNRPWNGAAPPEHLARIIDVATPDLFWNAEEFYLFREYRATMSAAMKAEEGAYPHYPHPELVPFVDDGSYAWLSVPNVCGSSSLCVDVANNIVYDVYACQNVYARAIGSASRADQLQSAGPAIRQKKGSGPMMGLAKLPVFPRTYSPGTADPPFMDTFASTERFPAAPAMPWFFPAFITQESGYAMVHIRVAFQHVSHSMGYKDDDGWSFGNGLHEDAPLTALPELLLMRDGNRTNLLSGITLDSAGGSGYSVTHDAGGVTIHARLSGTPNLVNHACFVRCREAYLFIQSPAANGRGAAPAEEENFNPYVEE